MHFKNEYERLLGLVEASLHNCIPLLECPESIIYEAARYSLLAGGKRLRPVLALATAELLGMEVERILPYACAIEMIHTYSLIHDDLPAMDNDDYRRGRLTSHKVYGEAVAILAGDALLNTAFTWMLKAAENTSGSLLPALKTIGSISEAAGIEGMIAGQVVDMLGEGKEISLEQLVYMHQRKTGALIKAPVKAAAILCEASPEAQLCLEGYSEKLGLAFQIKDDILDFEGDFEKLGKMTGRDVMNQKSTYVTILGLEESRILLDRTSREAVEKLEMFGDAAWFLRELAHYLLHRDH